MKTMQALEEALERFNNAILYACLAIVMCFFVWRMP
jgi:hypothetical protein